MSNPVTPQIPLRAGPSGPLINLAGYLEALDGFVAVRRVWLRRQAGDLAVSPGTTTPGTTIDSMTVPYTAEEIALQTARRLFYLVLGTMHANEGVEPDAFPTGISSVLNWQPAGGAVSTIAAQSLTPIPLAEAADFTFSGQCNYQHLIQGGVTAPPFVQGANLAIFSATDSGAEQRIVVNRSIFTMIELVGAEAQFSAA